MPVRTIGRRLFLLGSGGFALAIPALPSLLSRDVARAQAVKPPKRFVAMNIAHGGVWGEHLWPSDAMADQPFELPGLHTAHHGRLKPVMEGNETVLSRVLRAPTERLSAGLLSKMNLVRGLDLPFYIGHGNHNLGNYGGMSLAEDIGAPDQATIDQVMAYSPSFYPSVPRKRTIYLGVRGLSIEWVNPQARGGGFQALPSETSSTSLFSQIYVSSSSTPQEKRRSVVDRVLESYRRVESGVHGPGKRLGAEDRRRLRDYMDRLSAIEASLGAAVAANCADVKAPTLSVSGTDEVYGSHASDPDWYARNKYQVYNDIIVAAFMCNSSCIAVLNSADDWCAGMNAAGGFHEVAHAGNQAEKEALLQQTSKNFFNLVFLDLVNKMNAVAEADGSSLLDNSLVFWTHESGPATHDSDSTPVIAAGGAGGAIKTGNYVDFRDRIFDPIPQGEAVPGRSRRVGICYYQWLTTCLDAMSIPRSEWQTGGKVAFSPFVSAPSWYSVRPRKPEVWERMCNDALPILT